MPTKTRRAKYDDATLRAAHRAQELRGSSNLIAPITIERVRQALHGDAPIDALGEMSIRDAMLYAKGDKAVMPPDDVKARYSEIEDPFARGRGFVAACIALAGL